MRSFKVCECGAPLACVEDPTPRPVGSQVLLKVRAAGVREPLDAYARDHGEVRVMPGHFEEIRQAIATPKGRLAGSTYLHAFVEDMKANGFVADALKRSGQTAPVAPPAR